MSLHLSHLSPSSASAHPFGIAASGGAGEQLEQRQRRVWPAQNPILSVPVVAGIRDVLLDEFSVGGVLRKGFGAAFIPFLAVSLFERRGKCLLPTPRALDRPAGSRGVGRRSREASTWISAALGQLSACLAFPEEQQPEFPHWGCGSRDLRKSPILGLLAGTGQWDNQCWSFSPSSWKSSGNSLAFPGENEGKQKSTPILNAVLLLSICLLSPLPWLSAHWTQNYEQNYEQKPP